jgi:hypothetical protein
MHPAIYIIAGGALVMGVIVYLVRKYEQERTAELTELFLKTSL